MRPPKGMHYLRYLESVHLGVSFDYYLEIGSRNGASLSLSRSKSFAIDPFFRLSNEVLGEKPALHLFQIESNEFFRSDFCSIISERVGLFFIDGLHLIEQLLEDFIGCEKLSSDTSIIAMHDCWPTDFIMTDRDATKVRGPWVGDVWKILPILREFRPDLKVDILECKPTGLVLVSGLNRRDDTLERNKASILEKWVAVDFEDFGIDQLLSLYSVSLPARFLSGSSDYWSKFPVLTARPRPVFVSR